MKQIKKGLAAEQISSLPDVLSLRQLQMVLGIGKASTCKLLQAQTIHNFKIGKAYKIPKQSLVDYLQGGDLQ